MIKKNRIVVHINDSSEWKDANRFKLKELLKNYYYTFAFWSAREMFYNNLAEFVFTTRRILLVMGLWEEIHYQE